MVHLLWTWCSTLSMHAVFEQATERDPLVHQLR